MNHLEKEVYDTSLKARTSPTPDNMNRWRHACDDVSRGEVTDYEIHRSLANEQLMEDLS